MAVKIPTAKAAVTRIAAPKLPQGRPPSPSGQFRGSQSSYGALKKLAGGQTKFPKSKS